MEAVRYSEALVSLRRPTARQLVSVFRMEHGTRENGSRSGEPALAVTAVPCP
jgi:hypothetical protein